MGYKGRGWGSKIVHKKGKIRVFHQYLLSFLGKGTESEERPQQAVYYRTGHETRGLNLEGE